MSKASDEMEEINKLFDSIIDNIDKAVELLKKTSTKM